MPRQSTQSIDAIVQSSISAVMKRIAPRIAKAIADAAATKVEQELAVAARARPARARRRSRPDDLSRWVADSRARRVPKFVIEATGLDTKRKIVARFGPDVVFEKGKPLPPVAEQRSGAKAKRPAAKRAAPRPAPAKAAPAKPAPKAADAEAERDADAKKSPAPESARVVVARPPIVRKKAVAV